MGKAWKTAGIAGGLAMTLFIAYTQTPLPISWYHTLFFVFSLVALTVCFIASLVYIILFVRLRLYPLKILEDIECTYWTFENHFQVRWHICNRSDKYSFLIGYSALFKDGQMVDKEGTSRSDFYRGQADQDCLDGRKWWFKIYVRDIVINEPDECEITIITKPRGKLWNIERKIKQVKTLVVKHG
jgi:hypothetical protein